MTLEDVGDNLFAVFVRSLQLNDALYALVGDRIIAGIQVSSAEPYLVSGPCVSVQRMRETLAIKDQGYEDQYRTMCEFKYGVYAISKEHEEEAHRVSRTIQEQLHLNNAVVQMGYNGEEYNLIIKNTGEDPDFQNNTSFFVDAIVVDGFTMIKII